MQEQLPTTARMQEVEQCRSNCRENFSFVATVGPKIPPKVGMTK